MPSTALPMERQIHCQGTDQVVTAAATAILLRTEKQNRQALVATGEPPQIGYHQDHHRLVHPTSIRTWDKSETGDRFFYWDYLFCLLVDNIITHMCLQLKTVSHQSMSVWIFLFAILLLREKCAPYCSYRRILYWDSYKSETLTVSTIVTSSFYMRKLKVHTIKLCWEALLWSLAGSLKIIGDLIRWTK